MAASQPKGTRARARSVRYPVQVIHPNELRGLLRQAVEELRDHSIARVPKGKFIWDHTDVELAAAIDRAAKLYGSNFWVLLYGIDAYMERRKRRLR